MEISQPTCCSLPYPSARLWAGHLQASPPRTAPRHQASLRHAKTHTSAAVLLPEKLINIIQHRLPDHPPLKSPRRWVIRDWLDRLPAYLALSVWENSLPIQVYRAACYNSFVTTQIRQGKAILNHLSPPRSTAPIYMTFIKNPFIPKVNQGWNRYQLCMSWLSKMCYSVCLI